MLKRVLQGEEQYSFLLIEDSLECSGTKLLKAFVKNVLHRADAISVCLYESPADSFIADLPEVPVSKLRVVDRSSDPLGWLSGTREPLIASVPCIAPDKTGSYAVVVDCLSPAVLQSSAATVCQTLSRCRQSHSGDGSSCSNPTVIAALIHYDVQPAADNAMLELTADCIVKVTRSKPHNRTSCRITLKRPSGKVLVKNEVFTVDENFVVQSTEQVEIPQQLNRVKPQADPTANLPFNLTLKPTEELARSNTRLPYLPPTIKPSVAASGLPFMDHPDQAVAEIACALHEDIDEDPDDDLDI